MYGEPTKLITLVKYGVVREDDQEVLQIAGETDVWALDDRLSNGLYFRSNVEGYRLETSYLVHPFEYNGEERVRVDGKLLKVQKATPVEKFDNRWVQLIVGEISGRD